MENRPLALAGYAQAATKIIAFLVFHLIDPNIGFVTPAVFLEGGSASLGGFMAA